MPLEFPYIKNADGEVEQGSQPENAYSACTSPRSLYSIPSIALRARVHTHKAACRWVFTKLRVHIELHPRRSENRIANDCTIADLWRFRCPAVEGREGPSHDQMTLIGADVPAPTRRMNLENNNVK